MISTTVKKIKEIKNIRFATLGKVKYIDFNNSDEFPTRPLEQALVKRFAFEHEKEGRLITEVDLVKDAKFGDSHINIDINPINFIEEITIDPRAEDWFSNSIIESCKRVGFKIEPKKSSLYQFDSAESLRYYRRWILVDNQK